MYLHSALPTSLLCVDIDDVYRIYTYRVQRAMYLRPHVLPDKMMFSVAPRLAYANERNESRLNF